MPINVKIDRNEVNAEVVLFGRRLRRLSEWLQRYLRRHVKVGSAAQGPRPEA